MTKRPTLFSLILSIPLLLWQLLFFLFPLLFLVAISFWTVRNFQMQPDLNFGNWERVLTRGVFWDAYFRTMVLATAAAAITSIIAFPASYAISFKMSEKAKRWMIFILIIPFFTSYLVRVYLPRRAVGSLSLDLQTRHGNSLHSLPPMALGDERFLFGTLVVELRCPMLVCKFRTWNMHQQI